MKRIAIVAALLLAYTGLKAQDCDAIMLPYFNNNVERMENYKSQAPEKFEYRCVFAHSAFSEVDAVPDGAQVYSITDVRDRFTDKPLADDFVVDLNTLSYYGYNFSSFHPGIEGEVYFSTPGSSHRFLKLHSSLEMGQKANAAFEEAINKLF